MAINFPDPNTTTTYTFNGKTWEWNGRAWVIVSANLSTVSRYVYSINGYTGDIGFSAGEGISLTRSGITFIITNTGTINIVDGGTY